MAQSPLTSLVMAQLLMTKLMASAWTSCLTLQLELFLLALFLALPLARLTATSYQLIYLLLIRSTMAAYMSPLAGGLDVDGNGALSIDNTVTLANSQLLPQQPWLNHQRPCAYA